MLVQAIDFALDPDDQGKGHALLGTVSAVLAPGDWAQFNDFMAANPALVHPLDTWGRQQTKRMIENTALVAHFPDDQPAFPMISRALTVFPTLSQSPLGMLVSTRFGLLFGIRAWVEGDRASVERLAVSMGWKAGSPKHSPCDACVDKPCLTHCPVGAFDAHGYDYPKCQVELYRQMSGKGDLCWRGGCAARVACPLSTPYTAGQAGFHHRAVVANMTLVDGE